MGEETATRPTLAESFRAAVAQHSAEEPAEDSEQETTEPVDEVSATESAEAQTSEEKEEAADSDAETAEDIETLLSEEELEAYEGEEDPEKKLKLLNRAYTQKTQKLAEQRKDLEGWKQVIDAYNSDPRGTVRSIAEHLGLKIVEQGDQTAPEKVVETAEDAGKRAVERMRVALGPELEFLADRMAPVIEQLSRDVAQEVVTNAVGPLQQRQDAQLAEAAQIEVQTALRQFRSKHEDWPEYDSKIAELMQRYRPSKKVPLADYLEDLYTLATREKLEARATKKALERLKKSASKHSSEKTGVSEDKVQQKPPQLPSLRQAFDAAKRGEKWG